MLFFRDKPILNPECFGSGGGGGAFTTFRTRSSYRPRWLEPELVDGRDWSPLLKNTGMVAERLCSCLGLYSSAELVDVMERLVVEVEALDSFLPGTTPAV